MKTFFKKVNEEANASGTSKRRSRRLSSLAGKGYKVLVAIDGSKESWKTFEAVLYFLDGKKDELTTLTIEEPKTQADIKEKIRKVIDESGVGIPQKSVKIVIQEEREVRAKERIIKFANQGNFDLLALGIQGRKNSNMNRLRVFGSESDLSVRSVKCSTLIAKACAYLPREGESAKFVVGVHASTNAWHAYKTARAFMKEDDFLYLVYISPNGEVSKEFQEKFHFSEDMKDLKNYKFETLQGKAVAKELVDFCKKENAHFLFVGSDEMETWVEKEEMLGSISDVCVKDSECFVITTQLNVFEKNAKNSTLWLPDKSDN